MGNVTGLPSATRRVAAHVLDSLDRSYEDTTNELFFAARTQNRELMLAALVRLGELGDQARGLAEGLRAE